MAISPAYLQRLLGHFDGLAESKGLSSQDPVRLSEELDWLISNGGDAPNELFHALNLIHEMSTEEAMDELLRDSSLKQDAGDDPTAADVATLAWLRDQSEFAAKHAEICLQRPRVFDFLAGANSDCPNLEDSVTAEAIREIQSRLDIWFAENKRGRGCRIFEVRRDHLFWFLVRHGAPYRREGVLQGGQSSSIYFRPESHDVLAYDSKNNELRISLVTKSAKEEYRRSFGQALFRSEEHFAPTPVFTLEPLRKNGANTLVCRDTETIERICLVEIRYSWNGKASETEIHKASDVFAAFAARGYRIPATANITRASFAIKFFDSPRPRIVTVRPPNILELRRDSDSSDVEKWLRRRGFIQAKEGRGNG